MPQVAVFDTAFHQTLPPRAYTLCRAARPGRRRGSAATASTARRTRYVAAQAAAELLGRPLGELNLIVLHLGNGCSAAAVRGGRCVDTSMGLTPLEGLVMGTRSATSTRARRAPAREGGLALDEIDTLLNKEPG